VLADYGGELDARLLQPNPYGWNMVAKKKDNGKYTTAGGKNGDDRSRFRIGRDFGYKAKESGH
jgi:hypothetical protein